MWTPGAPRGGPGLPYFWTTHYMKIEFFPKIEKVSKCFNSCEYEICKNSICKANFGHFTSLRIFSKNTMGFELPSLTSIPFSSAITLSYLMIICCFYILCTPALFYLNPLVRFLLMSANIPDLSIMGIITSECLFRPIRRNIVFSRKRFFWANLLLPQVRKIWAKCGWDSNPDLSSRSQWASPLHYFHWW